MMQKQILIQIDNAYKNWLNTHNPYYEELWYKLVKDFYNERINNTNSTL
jgi:hypothetical protein